LPSLERLRGRSPSTHWFFIRGIHYPRVEQHKIDVNAHGGWGVASGRTGVPFSSTRCPKDSIAHSTPTKGRLSQQITFHLLCNRIGLSASSGTARNLPKSRGIGKDQVVDCNVRKKQLALCDREGLRLGSRESAIVRRHRIKPVQRAYSPCHDLEKPLDPLFSSTALSLSRETITSLKANEATRRKMCNGWERVVFRVAWAVRHR